MAKHTLAHGHVAANTTPKSKALQNHCFACGKNNPHGMRLKFYFDEEARLAFCKFKLARRYQGPPGHAHGGIIATILDEAMGKVNKLRSVIALTKSMNVQYLKPVPLGQQLTVRGREQQVVGREHTNIAEILNEAGDVLARSTGTFVAVDLAKMFARHLEEVDPAGS
jgi:uncharacterized protein (TIGR00369 family)